MKTAALLAATIIAGCATSGGMTREQERINKHHATCLGYGVSVGSAGYVSCRQTLATNQARIDAVNQAYLNRAIIDASGSFGLLLGSKL